MPRVRTGSPPTSFAACCALVLAAFVCTSASPAPARAQEGTPDPAARTVEFRFVPTERTQIALWIEKMDGTFLKTVRLTQAVSYRGIGNRPGATQMNSGFRWPYGRREGVLPVWAHRRAAAPGALQFPRVVFQDRISEGRASQAERVISYDSSPDQYFCLSFNAATTRKDALDAVSCATAFNSDKGRYSTTPIRGETVVRPETMFEPAVVNGQGMMRALDDISLYPPRRDIMPTGVDTSDVSRYVADARAVMPDIDTVTMATPPPDLQQAVLFTAPDEWPDGQYQAFIEVNVEGDYNGTFNDETYPTPTQPSGAWDVWAIDYGYPYRGQPSVVFAVPFTLGGAGTFSTDAPAGYGDVDGFGDQGGIMHAYVPGGVITDQPSGSAGSGADRLRTPSVEEHRFSVVVRDRTLCEKNVPPGIPGGLTVGPVADAKHAHEWGHLSFLVPPTTSPIAHYEVRYSRNPILAGDATSFEQAQPAVAAMIDSQALMVPANMGQGATVEVDFGGMETLTHYWVAIRAVDICNVAGPIAVAELTTARIKYTQLSGCFVATAAYGSPMEPEVGVLRTARDALRPRSVLAATATDLYYRSAPAAADVVARSELARAVARKLLGPVIEIARAAVDR